MLVKQRIFLLLGRKEIKSSVCVCMYLCVCMCMYVSVCVCVYLVRGGLTVPTSTAPVPNIGLGLATSDSNH